MKDIIQNFSFNIIWYPVIIIISVLAGAGLSYILDITKMLGIYKAHDMGLGNFFLSIELFFLIGQILSLLIFFHSKIIWVIIIFMIIDIIAIIKFAR